MLKKRFLTPLFLIVCISFLFAGCTININIGNPAQDSTKETTRKNLFSNIFNNQEDVLMYESRASVYITTKTATDATISSSDIKVAKSHMEACSAILQSDMIQDQIRDEYPKVECAIIATGEVPEHLEEICNMAVSLFCEEIQKIVDGVNCKVVDYARPAQLVGKE